MIKTNKKIRSILRGGSGLTAIMSIQLLMPAFAGAQELAAVEAPGGGEIIVTAQKRAESVNHVPMSITAVSGSDLQAKGVIDTSDLAKVVPGFTFNTDPRGAVVYAIRGIGFQDNTMSAAPAVTVYVDEVPLPYGVMTLGGSLDLERVEVLKGPQGTLYGQNSTGGLVNYIAAKPTDDVAAGANLRYGRFNTADLSGFVSGPIAEGLKVRLAARLLRGDAWQQSYTRSDELGRKNQLFGRLLIDWQPIDKFKVAINLNGWRDHGESQASQLVVVSPQSSNPANFYAPLTVYPHSPQNARAADWNPGRSYRRNNRFYQGSLRADYEVTDTITLTSLTSYEKYKMYMPIDTDGTALTVFATTRSGFLNTFFQELRASGALGAEGHWIVGSNYQHDNTYDFAKADFRESSNRATGPTLNNQNGQKVKTVSIYANGDLPLTDHLKLLGGLRYTKQDRDFVGCSRDSGDGSVAAAFNGLTGVPGQFKPGDCFTLTSPTTGGLIQSSLNEHNVSWRAGLSYEPARDVLFYANATRGYKAGSYPTISAARAQQLAPVVQESVLAYEGGFKLGLLDRKVQLNGAVFYYDYTNKQIRGRRDIPPLGSLEALVNVPKSHVIGAELDAVITAARGLTIRPSVSYVRSKIEGPFVNFTASGFAPAIELGGEAFPYTPKWTGNTDVEYRWSMSESLTAFVGANATYQTSSFAGFGELPLYKIRGYTLLDLRAGIESKDHRWNASIWGQNVTNRYYWVSGTRIQDVVTHVAGMPVTYGLSVGWHY